MTVVIQLAESGRQRSFSRLWIQAHVNHMMARSCSTPWIRSLQHQCSSHHNAWPCSWPMQGGKGPSRRSRPSQATSWCDTPSRQPSHSTVPMQLAEAGWKRSRQEIQAVEGWLCGMLKAAAAALASRQRTGDEVQIFLHLQLQRSCLHCHGRSDTSHLMPEVHCLHQCLSDPLRLESTVPVDVWQRCSRGAADVHARPCQQPACLSHAASFSCKCLRVW